MAFSQLPSSARVPSTQRSVPHPPSFQPAYFLLSHAQVHPPSNGPFFAKPAFKPVFVNPPSSNTTPPLLPPSGNLSNSPRISSQAEDQSDIRPRFPMPRSGFFTLSRSPQPPMEQAAGEGMRLPFRPSPPPGPAKPGPPVHQSLPSASLPQPRQELFNPAVPPLLPASPTSQCHICKELAQRLYTDVRCPDQCQVCVRCMVLSLSRSECPMCLRVLSRVENDTIELYGLSLQDEE